MSELLIETHFLPCVEYFCTLALYDNVVIEGHEHFVKQSYRNRCHILTAHGADRFSVPLTAKHGKVSIRSVQIDYGYRWQTNFWRTLHSAYANSPYFEHYKDDLHRELFSGEKYLFDLNQRLLSMCLTWLMWKKEITLSQEYGPTVGQEDLRNAISVKSDFTHRSFFQPIPYQQVFGKAFVPNLSILDLVFCTGPDARHIIEGSSQRRLNK